ncbi:hypothetical protein VSR68_08765 [Paraburkholderia phymatum]
MLDISGATLNRRYHHLKQLAERAGRANWKSLAKAATRLSGAAFNDGL